jgi:Ger(x)C family germination protein
VISLKRINLLFILIGSLCISGCYGYVPIEKIELNTGIGYDLLEKDGKIMFSDPTEILVFKGNRVFESKVIPGVAGSNYMISEQKEVQMAKKYILGPEHLYLISEKRARFGLEDFCDFQGRDSTRNINAKIAICKQSPEKLFSAKFTEYDSVSQQIEGIIRIAYLDYFFSSKFTGFEFLLESIQSGRQIYLPYLELVKENVKLTGVALFKDKKMFKVIPLEEARLINLIRYDKSISGENRGYLNITTADPLKYIDFLCSSKSKVKVSMLDHKLKYDVNVTINTVIKNYTLDKNDVLGDVDTKRIGKMLETKMEKKLEEEVEKVQTGYGFDCFDITKYALAKLGRNKGYESDEYFQNAMINVHVKVIVVSPGAISK